MLVRVMRSLLLVTFAALIAGCDAVVLSPSGDIAAQQRDLLLWSTYLMLLIIVPVMGLIVLFAWRYRASNKQATYKPDWDHSTVLELVIWAAPLLIIIALGALTWIGTHTLDPYRPIDRIAPGKPVAEGVQPLKIQAVAMDWKWLFIYPDLGIATVNELAAPVDRPIEFSITASSVMNALYVPALAGMIYAMPAVSTQLHAVINQPGDYDGISANYSGAGFSDMKFRFYGQSEADFEAWVAKAKAEGSTLQRAEYLELAKPSQREPVRRYATVEAGLYDAIVKLELPTEPLFSEHAGEGHGEGHGQGLGSSCDVGGKLTPEQQKLCEDQRSTTPAPSGRAPEPSGEPAPAHANHEHH